MTHCKVRNISVKDVMGTGPYLTETDGAILRDAILAALRGSKEVEVNFEGCDCRLAFACLRTCFVNHKVLRAMGKERIGITGATEDVMSTIDQIGNYHAAYLKRKRSIRYKWYTFRRWLCKLIMGEGFEC